MNLGAQGRAEVVLSSTDYERLELLFRRTSSLPPLPATALKLLHTLDAGDASAAQLERIIAGDPNLAGEFMRLAAFSGMGVRKYSSIRDAILVLGQRAVRSVATSLVMRQMTMFKNMPATFNRERFTRHSIAVGIIARYLFARKQKSEPFTTKWTPDEVFAAGLLKDLAIGLMVRLAPDAFSKVYLYAKQQKLSFEAGFMKVYKSHYSSLCLTAADVWKLQPIFRHTFQYVDKPWEAKEEKEALYCLHYAGHLARRFGFSIVEWPVAFEVDEEVTQSVGISDEEQEVLRCLVEQMVTAFLQTGRKAA